MNEKQALWRDPAGMYGSFACSACGGASGVKTRYCRHCGARMENFASERVQDAEAGKAGESAFDGVNWKWLLPLLLFPFASDPPRREISVTANVNGKSVVITYDPHDPEAVKAADVWREALFASGTRHECKEPVAVRPGDTVTFTGPRKETNGDKIRKADISTLSELLAAVKFSWWDNSYEIKPGVSVPHPEIFNKLSAYAGRMASGDIACLDLIRAMTDNDLSEWLCLFQAREAEAWERLLGAPPDYSKPLIPESEREKFFFWLKKRPGADCTSETAKAALDDVLKRIRREGYCCPSCGCDSLRQAAEPLRNYLKAHGDPHTSVIVTQDGATETQDERRVKFDRGTT